MTVAQNTATLLLDEPTTFLDMAHQLEVLQLLNDLNRREGRTIVMVVHDLNHAARYADHLIAMAGGRIVRQGAPGDVVTPKMLRDVFGVEANVRTDPRTGVKLCIPYRVYEPTADELEPMGFALEAAGTGR